MSDNTHYDKLISFIAGCLSVEQAEALEMQIDHWDCEQFFRFGRLIGQSRKLNQTAQCP